MSNIPDLALQAAEFLRLAKNTERYDQQTALATLSVACSSIQQTIYLKHILKMLYTVHPNDGEEHSVAELLSYINQAQD